MNKKIIEVICQVITDFIVLFLVGTIGGFVKHIFDLEQKKKFNYKQIFFKIFFSGIVSTLFGFFYITTYGNIDYTSKSQFMKMILFGIIIGIFGSIIIREGIFTINKIIKDFFSKFLEYLIRIKKD